MSNLLKLVACTLVCTRCTRYVHGSLRLCHLDLFFLYPKHDALHPVMALNEHLEQQEANGVDERGPLLTG